MARRLAYVLLRVYAGVFFLVTAHYKLVQEGYSIAEKIAYFRESEYVPMIQHAIRIRRRCSGCRSTSSPPSSGRHAAVRWVLRPRHLVFEALLGLTLILGFGVRLVGGWASCSCSLSPWRSPTRGPRREDPVGVFLFTVKSANWPLTLILLAVCLVAAGRVLGLDRWVRRRWPPLLRWIG